MITLKYDTTTEQEALIINAIAEANNYSSTIQQDILHIDGNIQFDEEGLPLTETVPNPLSIRDYAQLIIDKELQAIVLRAFKKIEQRKQDVNLKSVKELLLNIQSEKI